MSYSSEIKNELCAQSVQQIKSCCALSELMGIILSSKHVSDEEILIYTENATLVRHIFTLLKTALLIHSKIEIRKSGSGLYKVHVLGQENINKIKSMIFGTEGNKIVTYRVNRSLIKSECCMKALLRGLYLGAGFISDPQKSYHFEIVTQRYNLSCDILEILSKFYINAKVMRRKSNYVVYIKDSETIADVLAALNVYSGLMKFHNEKIMKEMKNDITRIVNCEQANIDKTVNASAKQTEAINKIKKTSGLQFLQEDLREISELRLDNPEASLAEIALLYSKPISKSGISHKFKRLQKMAEEIQ